QRLADRLEAAGELVVLAGPPDVVEDRQQLAEDLGQRLLLHRLPVALDPLAVVGVLRLHALEVLGELGDPDVRLDGRHGLRVDHRLLLAGLLLGDRLRSLLPLRGAKLAGLRIDAPLVADHRPFPLLAVPVLRQCHSLRLLASKSPAAGQAFPSRLPLSSSTISASTTSGSSWSWAAPAPEAPSAACCWP